jgi:hypothetical protein
LTKTKRRHSTYDIQCTLLEQEFVADCGNDVGAQKHSHTHKHEREREREREKEREFFIAGMMSEKRFKYLAHT